MKLIKYGFLICFNILLFYYLWYWSSKNIQWEEFMKALPAIPGIAIASAFILGLITLFYYAQRLACMINKGYWPCFFIVCFGFGANNILPFRSGDILKLYFARKYYDVSATRLLFIKIMEKYFDLIILLLIGFSAFLFGMMGVDKIYLLSVLTILVLIMVGVVVAILIVRQEPNWMLYLKKYKIINHITGVFEEVITSTSLKKALLITVAIWIVTVVTMYVYYKIVLLGFPFGWGDALALVFVTSLSLGVPSSPGAFGVFEAAIVFYLTNFVSVTAEKALAAAVVLHVIIAVPQIFLMFFSLVKARMEIIEHQA